MVKRLGLFGIVTLVAATIHAQNTTTVGMDSGSQGQILFNQGSTPLSGGTAADGDGFVLQLGYFSGATTANNFSGTFIPLTGQGSANTAIIPGSVPPEMYNQTSIGDNTASGGSDGMFFISGLNFTQGSPTSGNNLPAAGTPLAVRFYNNTTIAGSTFYNTVSDDAWIWKDPALPPSSVAISLDDANLEWESIARVGQASNTAFHTSIPTAIPEPTTYALLGLGTLGLAIVRRRQANKV